MLTQNRDQFFTHIFQIVRLFSQRKPLIKKNRVVGAAYFLHFPFRLLPVLKNMLFVPEPKIIIALILFSIFSHLTGQTGFMPLIKLRE